MRRLSAKIVARYWLPAVAMLVVIRLESTAVCSGGNTFLLLHRILQFLHLHMNPISLAILNFCLRKAGHLTGYGLLGLFTFRAIQGTSLCWRYGFPWWRNAEEAVAMARQGWHLLWKLRWAVTGVAVAGLTGLCDELHQMTLPGRDGTMRDVLIDTCGAIALQIVVFCYYRLRYRGTSDPS
jgi:hypothetical protein